MSNNLERIRAESMGYSLAEVNAKKQGSETRKQTLNRLASNLEKAENVVF